MFKRCVLFFIIILFIYLGEVHCQEENSSLCLEPIVITKDKVHLLDSYIIESKAIKNLGFSSYIEVLSILPLDLQSRSPTGAVQIDFSLRGSTFQEVLILVDGQRINDPQTAHHNSDIPFTKLDIEKIEVTPGLSSSRFGPDAIGGAINFKLKKPEEKKKILEAGIGEYQSKFGLFSITEKIDNLGIRFSQEIHESGGFYTDTDFKKYTSSLNSYLDIPDGEFKLSLGYLEKEFGAYDFYTPGSGYLSKEWTKTYLVDTGLNLEKNEILIKPNFLWRRHFDKFLLDKTLARSNYLNHHRTDLYTPSIYFQSETDNLGKLGLGLEYGQERINSTNLGKHNRQHQSIFLDNQISWTKGLSSDFSLRADDFDGFGKVYTGSTDLSLKFSEKQTISFGVSRSMRIPSFTELCYDDPTTLGNSGLSAEKSVNFQSGYDYKKDGLSFGTVLFFRKEEDFIDWIKRTSTQAKWQTENLSNADAYGIENYLGLNLNEYLNINSNYTYINKKNDDTGFLYKYGQNYTRHLINTILTFELPFGIQSIGFTYKKKPNRDGWLLVNLGLSYALNENWQIFLRGTNLFNVEYQEIEGIPQPGRCLNAGLHLSW